MLLLIAACRSSFGLKKKKQPIPTRNLPGFPCSPPLSRSPKQKKRPTTNLLFRLPSRNFSTTALNAEKKCPWRRTRSLSASAAGEFLPRRKNKRFAPFPRTEGTPTTPGFHGRRKEQFPALAGETSGTGAALSRRCPEGQGHRGQGRRRISLGQRSKLSAFFGKGRRRSTGGDCGGRR